MERFIDDLAGLDLRCVLVVALRDAGRPLTTAQLVERVERLDVPLRGRPSKVIADALRWEVARGRVHRLGRGRYRVGYLAKSTEHRMRGRARAATATIRRRAADRLAAGALVGTSVGSTSERQRSGDGEAASPLSL